MSTIVSVAGSSYSVPQEGDSGWANDVTNLLIQLATSTKVLQVNSNSFPLNQELSFGNSYGIKVQYIKSQATNPSSTGVVRLGNNESIGFRNAANSADFLLTVNASNKLTYNSLELVDLSSSQILSNKSIDADNNAVANLKNINIHATAAIAYSKLNLSGAILNADISASAAIAYSKLNLATSIVNADISASAAIARSKLATLTASRAMVTDGSGNDSVSAITATELGYLSGVTSAIQTQFTNKQDASTAVTLTGVQTLTNKTLTSPTLTTPLIDIDTFTDQSSTPASPAAGKRKLYSKTTGKFYQLDSSGVERELGSGGTGVNFVIGGDAEGGSIFATYKDAASAIPADGTGGTPTISSASTTSTNPLSGANSFLLTHPASNAQGEGWSYDFSIDLANKAKVLKIEFDYILNSGTFIAGSSGVDSDIEVYIYDVTNGTIIQPSSYKLLSNSSTVADHFSATFQTASNSTSYRLIFHCATTAASSFVLKLDSLSIAPSTYVFGTPITDWVTTTVTCNLTNQATLAKKRRVGDSIEYAIQTKFSGTPGAALATWTLPDTIDAVKLAQGTVSTVDSRGQANIYDASTSITYTGSVATASSTGVQIFVHNTSSALSASVPVSFTTSDYIELSFSVPVVGLSSSVQMSDQADTRIVSFFGVNAGTQAVTSGTTNVNFTASKDSHSAWTGSTYVVPVPGDYNVATAIYSTGAAVQSAAYVNGTIRGYIGYSVANTGSGGSILLTNLKVGDIVSVRALNTLTIASDASQTISISRVAGPSSIAATESINCRYTTSSSQAMANNADTTILYDTKDYDTHGAYNTSTGIFTAPISGKYHVDAKFRTVGYTGGPNTHVIRIYKGTPSQTLISQGGSQALAVSISWSAQVGDTIQLNAGDQIILKCFQDSGTSRNLSGSNVDNFFSIFRVGN